MIKRDWPDLPFWDSYVEAQAVLRVSLGLYGHAPLAFVGSAVR